MFASVAVSIIVSVEYHSLFKIERVYLDERVTNLKRNECCVVLKLINHSLLIRGTTTAWRTCGYIE